MVLSLTLVPGLGHAAVFVVNNMTDGMSFNQLRGALAEADALGGANTIELQAGTYELASSITFGAVAGENVTITGVGAGSTIIQMTGQDRIFILNTTALITNLTVTISGVTFTGGQGAVDGFGGGVILSGGPGNITSITNCVFSGNNSSLAGNSTNKGGAIAMEGGGQNNVTGCTFTSNTLSNGTGGAIFYFQPDNEAGGLSVTNCTFTGNSVSGGSSPTGGAIYVDIQGTTLATSISITGNTFTGNSVSTSGVGGAIDINNGSTATALIKFNRFDGNTGTFPDVSSNSNSGNVDITNNWWGRNVSPVSAVDPHVGIVGTGGTGGLAAGSWLELTCAGTATSLCDGSGENSTTVTASFLKNSAGTLIAAGNLTALVGVAVNFSSAQGTISAAQTTIQSNGTATATFTDNGATGTANVYSLADSVTTADAVADGTIAVNAPSALAAVSTSGSVTVSSTTPVVTDGSCNQICSVLASGASPLSGLVTAGVTLDPSVQSVGGQPYVTRHYDITPAANASTATASVTLYFLQSEFNAYNAMVANSSLWLPISSGDVTGRGNLTISQFHGTGTKPGSYSGWTGPGPASVLISPGSSNVIWNSAKSWWEVSFPVTGFSGFYVTGPISAPLPVVLEGFGGVLQGTGVLLNWVVGLETGLLSYEVEGSTDGVAFSALGSVLPTSSGASSSGAGSYQYFVADPAVGANYYRLKMVNTDGTFSYSNVAVVEFAGHGAGVRVLGNPLFAGSVVQVTAVSGGPVSLRLTDISGKTLWVRSAVLGVGVNTFALSSSTGSLARGVYLLTVVSGEMRETVKVVKE